jgi:serine/threonine-protein kinase
MPVEDHASWNVGRYTVHGELASGGMATVHIGRMNAAGGFSKLVAIKRMHPQFAKDPDFLAMFVDEARLAARIRHPNVVQSLDVIAEGGEVLLVMEYIHGDALSRINRVLRAGQERIPLRIAISIMSGMLQGLHAAHEAKSEKGEPLGIVHRDVSPQNVIVGVDGVARVLDFGIAKAADQVHLTREGELKGKLVYMAPEQLLGETLTRRTDIFSAAVVLWESLTGQRLFESDSQSALLARARMQKVDAPSMYAPEISPQLDAIVAKGLAMSQGDRWQTARDMALALEECIPPATTAQVGAWIEKVCARALAERQARIDEIEAAGADSNISAREMVKDITSDRVFTQDILSARSKTGPRITPPPPPPAPGAASQSGSNPAQRDLRTPISQVGRMTPTPPAISNTLRSQQQQNPFGGNNEPTRQDRVSDFGRPPSIPDRANADRLSAPPAIVMNAPSVHNPYYVPPAAPLAPTASGPTAPLSLEAPAIPTELAKPAKTTVVKMGRKGAGTAIVLLVIVVFVVGLLGSPVLVRRSFVDALAKRGIVATIEEVDLYSQIGTARIVGLAMTSADVPGATVHAHEVLVDLNSDLDPKAIIARDVDVNIEVGYAPFVKSLDAWSKKNGKGSPLGVPESLQHARIESGHIVWNQPSGPGTRFEARSLTLDFAPKERRPIGQDFTMEPTSFDLTTPLGPLGPWLLDASKTGPQWAVHVSFNQAHQQSYGFDITHAENGDIKADLRAPRATPADLGTKPDMFGAAATDKVSIDGVAHAERKAGAWSANGNVSIDGFHLPNARPAPLAAELTFAGPGGAPLDVQRGRLSLGNGDGSLTGAVTLLDDAIVAKLASTVSVRCDDGVARALLSLSLDSRDLGAASLSPQTKICFQRK